MCAIQILQCKKCGQKYFDSEKHKCLIPEVAVLTNQYLRAPYDVLWSCLSFFPIGFVVLLWFSAMVDANLSRQFTSDWGIGYYERSKFNWQFITYILCSMVVCSFTGTILGYYKRRPGLGRLLGVLLGIFGIIIFCFIPGYGRPCPFCLCVVKDSAIKCSHCQSDI